MPARATAACLALLLALQPGLLLQAQELGPKQRLSQLSERNRGLRRDMIATYSAFQDAPNSSNIRRDMQAAANGFQKANDEAAAILSEAQEERSKLSKAASAGGDVELATTLGSLDSAVMTATTDRAALLKPLARFKDYVAKAGGRSKNDLLQHGADFEKEYGTPYNAFFKDMGAVGRALDGVRSQVEKQEKAYKARLERAQAQLSQIPESVRNAYRQDLDKADALARSGDSRGAQALLAKVMDGASGHMNSDVDEIGRIVQSSLPESSDVRPANKRHLDDVVVPTPGHGASGARPAESAQSRLQSAADWVGERWDDAKRRVADARDQAARTATRYVVGSEEPTPGAISGATKGAAAGAAVGGAVFGGAFAAPCLVTGAAAPVCVAGVATAGAVVGGTAGALSGAAIGAYIDKSRAEGSLPGLN